MMVQRRNNVLVTLAFGALCTMCMTTQFVKAADPEASVTIAESITADENFSTLLAAISVADAAVDPEADPAAKTIVELLSDPDQQFTVFAPDNDAIASSLEKLGMTQDELLADPANLKNILLFHVVEGKTLAADLTNDMKIDTLLQEDGAAVPITVTVDGETVMLDGDHADHPEDDEATVIGADIMASNGVIHKINGILMPPLEGGDDDDGDDDAGGDDAGGTKLTGPDAGAAIGVGGDRRHRRSLTRH